MIPSIKKIFTVVGARPQFVKAAALSKHLKTVDGIQEHIVHTGQHFDYGMSDIFFSELGIPTPLINLNIGGGSHGQNTGRMIESLEKVFVDHRPDAVLVFGDTDSTLAAAIAASKLGIVLAHVEAGLRSYRRAMPEEINRVLTDHASDILYAPSPSAVSQLIKEGIRPEKIVLSGDVMLDAVRHYAEQAKRRTDILSRIGLADKPYKLMTLHRKENVDDPGTLTDIFRGLEDLDEQIVFLVHPRTSKKIAEFKILLPSCILQIEPVGYLDMLALLAGCSAVLTDSGGLQKEAYFLGKRCITLREETEWAELIEVGANVLVGSSPEMIRRALDEPTSPMKNLEIYGKGNACELIADDLLNRLATN